MAPLRSPLLEDNHGMHVAGMIHLMAPEAEINDCHVFGKEGKLGVSEAIAAAVCQAVKDECNVTNMSAGGPFPNSAICDAVKHAKKLAPLPAFAPMSSLTF